jgi:biotin transport system substrate-specific component
MSVAVNIWNRRSKVREFIGDTWMSFCGSMVIAISAPVSLSLGFTAVPITMQVHVALLVSYLLGGRKGPMAVLMFLSYGLMGYPVFASGFAGAAVFVGPTGGYLLGYFLAASMISLFIPSTRMKTFAMFTFANAVVYCFGVMWLSGFVGIYRSITLGVLPFLVGDFVKLLLITKLAFAPKVHSTLKRLGGTF